MCGIARALRPSRREALRSRFSVSAATHGSEGRAHVPSAGKSFLDRMPAARNTARSPCRILGRITMRYSIAVAATLSTLMLSACDRPATVVVPATPPAVVTVPGPGRTARRHGRTGRTRRKRRHRRDWSDWRDRLDRLDRDDGRRRSQGRKGQDRRRHHRRRSRARRSPQLTGAGRHPSRAVASSHRPALALMAPRPYVRYRTDGVTASAIGSLSDPEEPAT